MIGYGGAKTGRRGQSIDNAGMAMVGLFPGSDSDEEYGGSTTPTPPAKNLGAAQQDWSIFPDNEESTTQPAAAAAKGSLRGKHHRAASTVAGVKPAVTLVSEKVASGNGEQNSGKKKKPKKKPTAVGKDETEEITRWPSPLHEGVENDDEIDLEAARGTRPPSKSKSAEERAIDEFELNKDRSPAEWMRVGDTTGIAFLWYTLILQIASASCSIVFLASHGENQLSWKTGCWGLWTSLADAEDVDFVEFDTHIGWQLYGKGDRLGFLSEVSQRAAIIGGLAGGMHTLMVFVAIMFLFFSVSALWLSYIGLCCPQRRPSEEQEEREEQEEDGGPTKPVKHENPLGLGRYCHRWMFVMAGIDIVAGLWFFWIGCFGFYWVVTHEFTEGLGKLVSGWGKDVTCATPQTSPRYGFYVNAVAVFLLLGGGIISLYKAYTSDRDLSEAVEMWEFDRAETAEMKSRLAMIKKKEDYAAAVAAAAASAAQTPVTIFKSRKTTPAADAADAADAESNKGPNAAPPPPPKGVHSVLALSPSSEISRQSTRSFTAVPGPGERHKRKVTMAALSAADLESEDGRADGTVSPASALSQPSTPPVSRSRQTPEPGVESPDWDVESGVGAAGAGAGADAGAATLDNAGESAVEDDSPPPPGWEVRTTPSGEKFWVNIVTKDVSWDKPTE